MTETSSYYSITVQPATLSGDLYGNQPCFLVDKSAERIGRVYLMLTGGAAAIALNQPDVDTNRLNQLLMRYGTDRLVSQLSRAGGEEELFGSNATQEWVIDLENLRTELLSPQVHQKACRYQIEEQRDLYCAAASANDKTVVGSLGISRVAPTSRPICDNCAVPDERIICSFLSHPAVTSILTPGLPRRLTGAMCNQGQAGIEQPADCRAGGHNCWTRLIPVPTPPLPRTPSPLSLPEALDFLDSVWRLAGNGRLVRPTTFTDAAGLISDCDSVDEFEARLSDIADALDRIQVSASLLPEDKKETQGALNQFREVLVSLDDVDLGVVGRSVQTLQRVRGLRHTHQHSREAYDRPKILGDLGIPDAGLSWSESLHRVRTRTVDALLALRTEIRRTIKDDG
jgi:hypothetical protein